MITASERKLELLTPSVIERKRERKRERERERERERKTIEGKVFWS